MALLWIWTRAEFRLRWRSLTVRTLLIPGALLLANLAAVVPAIRAVRARPADVLRTE